MHVLAAARGRWTCLTASALARARPLGIIAIVCATWEIGCDEIRAQGVIQTIVDDVHNGTGGGATEESPRPADQASKGRPASASSDDSDSMPFEFVIVAGYSAFYAATSPFWLPIAALEDDGGPAYFPRFPYDHVAGHLAEGATAAPGRLWSGRFSAEYLEPFTDVNGVGGRLLVSTTSRFGLDAEASHFEERRPHGGFDTLWIGDANLVFRFAQAEKAEFRAGLGFNWLDHPHDALRDADFGFNFTYGADFFPRKPWVLSADLDAGTLGRTGLVRFRTTGGIMLRSLECYTGYEYLDVGRTHFNLLLAGVRLWF